MLCRGFYGGVRRLWGEESTGTAGIMPLTTHWRPGYLRGHSLPANVLAALLIVIVTCPCPRPKLLLCDLRLRPVTTYVACLHGYSKANIHVHHENGRRWGLARERRKVTSHKTRQNLI